MSILENEQYILELEENIDSLKRLAANEELGIAQEIQNLEFKLKRMKEKTYLNLSPSEKVSVARHPKRPTALDYISVIFDDFFELHGDRLFADDLAIVGGIAKLNGKNVTVIAEQKGRNTKENVMRNFSMPHPEGYRKALRLSKQAEKFNRPIVYFVDTPGAYCGIGAEERGEGEAIAKNLLELSRLKVPTISVIIGEGGSGGALALAVTDKVWMLEHSIYSILSPEGFATILWKDSSRAEEAAAIMKITAEELKEFNIIDRIIEEPGSAHKNPEWVAKKIKEALNESFEELGNYSSEELLTKRYQRFRKFGEFEIKNELEK